MKPVPVVVSPVLISSGDEELLSWFVVVQEVTKNRRTTYKTKKRENFPELSRLVLTFSCIEVICILSKSSNLCRLVLVNVFYLTRQIKVFLQKVSMEFL